MTGEERRRNRGSKEIWKNGRWGRMGIIPEAFKVSIQQWAIKKQKCTLSSPTAAALRQLKGNIIKMQMWPIYQRAHRNLKMCEWTHKPLQVLAHMTKSHLSWVWLGKSSSRSVDLEYFQIVDSGFAPSCCWCFHRVLNSLVALHVFIDVLFSF